MTSVDWAMAERTARRLVRPGPDVTHADAAAAVRSLRGAADRASELVAEVTGLDSYGEPAPVHVIDRPTWLSANVASFAGLLEPLTDRFRASRFTAGATGVEVGAALAYLSGRVLGQYDPYHDPSGRLLLVAPNIVQAERELGVRPADFRLWVAVHEQTHVVQFTHALDGRPWLRDHLRSRITALLEQTDLGGELVTTAVRGLTARARGGTGETSLMDLVTTDEQRALIAEVTAVMSLLEGHADLVMDEVGPAVIPSVAAIRSRFEQRRARGGADRLVRALLGLDAKLRQYRDGVAFCRAVVQRAGMAGLNRVFTAPATLPRLDEITAPDRWLARVQP